MHRLGKPEISPDRHCAAMSTVERTRDRAARRAARILASLGEELREARLSAGLSQAAVAEAAEISRARYGRIERGLSAGLSVRDLARLGAVLGLDLGVRLFPAGAPLRDAAQVRKLTQLISLARRPLRCRTEVGLPRTTEHVELRSWDAVLDDASGRTKVEVEMRLHDAQALERRVNLKRRDDPAGGFLLVVADTDRNRSVLAEHPNLFPDLPRLRPSIVRAALLAGRLPPTGLVVL
jgi:transcriptional regulator with XRE-family HTH domain